VDKQIKALSKKVGGGAEVDGVTASGLSNWRPSVGVTLSDIASKPTHTSAPMLSALLQVRQCQVLLERVADGGDALSAQESDKVAKMPGW
jgi:hypothetical protein